MPMTLRWLPENDDDLVIPSDQPKVFVSARRANAEQVERCCREQFPESAIIPYIAAFDLCRDLIMEDVLGKEVANLGAIVVIEATIRWNFYTVDKCFTDLMRHLSLALRQSILPLVLVDDAMAHTMHLQPSTGKKTFDHPNGPRDLTEWLKNAGIRTINSTSGDLVEQLAAVLQSIHSCLPGVIQAK